MSDVDTRESSPGRQRALLELASLQGGAFPATLRQILRIDAQALGVERVSFWWLRRRSRALECELCYLASKDAFEAGACVTAPGYLTALERQEVIAADDARSDERTREFTEDYLVPLGITSMLDVPVWWRGEVVGVVCHEHVGPPRRWSPADCELATVVAQAVTIALEARQRSAAEHAGWRADFLARATAALTETLDVEQIPARLARLAVPDLAEWCAIDTEEQGRIRRVAAAHADPRRARPLLEWAEQRGALPARLQPAATVLETGTPIFIPSATRQRLRALTCTQETEFLIEQGTRSLLAVPLIARGRRLGALTLGSGRARRSFHRKDLELVQALADRAAIALENGRLLRETQRAVAARDEFIAVASHELSTPIMSLKLAVQALEGERLTLSPEAAARAAAVARRQVDRIEQLVGELLNVTRIRAGRLPLQLEQVELGAVVREVAARLAPVVESVGSRLTIDCPRPVLGRWDRSRLEQVVTNLLTNALKFGGGAPVDVLVDADAERARLAVRDHGPGVQPEQLSLLFEPYHQERPTPQGGLGLGLFIVRGIVEALGGTATAESRVGEGATFRVELPLAPSGRQAA